MADVVDGEIAVGEGKSLDYDVNFVEGQLVLSMKFDGQYMDSELKVSLDSDQLLDKLAARIPGKVDDAILGMLKVLLSRA